MALAQSTRYHQEQKPPDPGTNNSGYAARAPGPELDSGPKVRRGFPFSSLLTRMRTCPLLSAPGLAQDKSPGKALGGVQKPR